MDKMEVQRLDDGNKYLVNAIVHFVHMTVSPIEYNVDSEMPM